MKWSEQLQRRKILKWSKYMSGQKLKQGFYLIVFNQDLCAAKKKCLNKTNQSLVLRSESFSPLNEKIFDISIHSCALTTPHQHVSKISDGWSIHLVNHFEAHPSIESNELTTKKAKGFKFAAQTNDGGKASNSRNIM